MAQPEILDARQMVAKQCMKDWAVTAYLCTPVKKVKKALP
jgi:hypothetical protein